MELVKNPLVDEPGTDNGVLLVDGPGTDNGVVEQSLRDNMQFLRALWLLQAMNLTPFVLSIDSITYVRRLYYLRMF